MDSKNEQSSDNGENPIKGAGRKRRNRGTKKPSVEPIAPVAPPGPAISVNPVAPIGGSKKHRKRGGGGNRTPANPVAPTASVEPVIPIDPIAPVEGIKKRRKRGGRGNRGKSSIITKTDDNQGPKNDTGAGEMEGGGQSVKSQTPLKKESKQKSTRKMTEKIIGLQTFSYTMNHEKFLVSYINQLQSIDFVWSDFTVLIPSMEKTLDDDDRCYSFLINIFTYLRLDVKNIIIFYHRSGNIERVCNRLYDMIRGFYSKSNIEEDTYIHRIKKIKFVVYDYQNPRHIGIARMAIANYLFTIPDNKKIIISDDRRYLMTNSVDDFVNSLKEIDELVDQQKIVTPAKTISSKLESTRYPTQIVFATSGTIKNVYRKAFEEDDLLACFPRIMEDYNFATLIPKETQVHYTHRMKRQTKATNTEKSEARKVLDNAQIAKIFGSSGQEQTKHGIHFAVQRGKPIKTKKRGKYKVARGHTYDETDTVPYACSIQGNADCNKSTIKFLDAYHGQGNFTKYWLDSIQDIPVQLLQKRPKSSINKSSLIKDPTASEIKDEEEAPLQRYISAEELESKLNPFTKADIINAIYKRIIPSYPIPLKDVDYDQQIQDQKKSQETSTTQKQQRQQKMVQKIQGISKLFLDAEIREFFYQRGMRITKPLSFRQIEESEIDYDPDPFKLKTFTKPFLARLFKRFLHSNRSFEDLEKFVILYKSFKEENIPAEEAESHIQQLLIQQKK